MSASVKKHFILIDDNEIDLMLHHKIIDMTLPNATVSKFTSAEVALDYLKKIQHPESYILLLDIKMPVMDGFQFLAVFSRLSEELLSHTKIFLLSSSSNQFDISRAQNNTLVSAMITKPLTKELLLTILNS